MNDTPPKVSTELIIIVLAILVSACLTTSIFLFPQLWDTIFISATRTPLP